MASTTNSVSVSWSPWKVGIFGSLSSFGITDT